MFFVFLCAFLGVGLYILLLFYIDLFCQDLIFILLQVCKEAFIIVFMLILVFCCCFFVCFLCGDNFTLYSISLISTYFLLHLFQQYKSCL